MIIDRKFRTILEDCVFIARAFELGNASRLKAPQHRRLMFFPAYPVCSLFGDIKDETDRILPVPHCSIFLDLSGDATFSPVARYNTPPLMKPESFRYCCCKKDKAHFFRNISYSKGVFPVNSSRAKRNISCLLGLAICWQSV